MQEESLVLDLPVSTIYHKHRLPNEWPFDFTNGYCLAQALF